MVLIVRLYLNKNIMFPAVLGQPLIEEGSSTVGSIGTYQSFWLGSRLGMRTTVPNRYFERETHGSQILM